MNGNLYTFGNIATFMAVLGLTVVVVIIGQRRKSESKDSFIDYLIMGRSLTLPFFVGSLVSTWYGGIFGVTQIAFESGVYNFITQGVFWYITYILFALFLVKRIKRFDAVTLPELVSQMFGPKSAKLAAVFNLFNVIPIAYTISIGLLISTLTGFPQLPSMIIGVAIALSYSLIGGFRSVVLSDFVQFIIMFIAVILVVVFSYTTYGGLNYLQLNLPPTHFSPLGSNSVSSTLVWGFIALSTLVDPNFYQRTFAAKDEVTARHGILISTAIWFLFDICTTLGGMYARAAMPTALSTHAYLNYSLQLLPNIVQGFFLAGICATIFSTLDSYLFLSGTTLSYDLLPPSQTIGKKAGGDIRKNIALHRLSTLFIGLISILMAVAFDGDIKQVWKILGSYSASCLLLPVLVGHIFPGHISDRVFFCSSLFGAIVVTLWMTVIKSLTSWPIDEIYVGFVATFFSLSIGHFFSARNAQKD